MGKRIRSDQLAYRVGTSDKVYNLALDEAAGRYTVSAEWGRRGSLLRVDSKYVGPDRSAAEEVYEQIRKEKLAKGYSSGTPDGTPPPVPAGAAGQAAWLPTDLDEAEAQRLLKDRAWVMQEKADGIHVMVREQSGLVTAYNRRGEPYGLPEAIALQFCAPALPCLIDGEWLQRARRYVAYDILEAGDMDLRKMGYAERFKRLVPMVRAMGGGSVGLIRSADTPGAKVALLAALRGERAEGVIFKHRDAPYVSGRPPHGGFMRRWKFRERADVIVRRRPGDSKRSFDMFAMGQTGPVEIGSVSAHTFYGELKPGEALIAEVSYLYASDESRLIQPSIVRLRTDKRPEECRVDQLKVGKRFEDGHEVGA